MNLQNTLAKNTTPQEDEIKLSKEKLKIVCVLYDDPVDEYPPKYARADIPKITKYPGGQTTPVYFLVLINPRNTLRLII